MRKVNLLTGAALVLLAGMLHHGVHAARSSLARRYVPPARPLADLPKRLGDYTFDRELPLDDVVLEVANLDAYVSRQYIGPGDDRIVSLYVGYWGRRNVGMGHGPEVCFPSAGWAAEGPPRERRVRFVDVGGREREATLSLHRFSRTDPLGLQRVAVAFIAVIDGEFRGSSRGFFLHRPAAGPDRAFLAHIEAMTSVGESGPDAWQRAEETLVAFMRTALPHLAGCIFRDETPPAAMTP